MRSAFAGIILAVSLFTLPGLAAAPKSVDLAKITSHLKEHQTYPATRAQLIETCTDLKDFSEAEKKWFIGALPDRTFNSAEDVVKALKAAK